MRKKRQLRMLLILMFLLALSAICFVLAKNSSTDETEETEETASLRIYPEEFDASKLVSFSYTPAAKKLTFTGSEDNWVYAGNTRFPLNQTTLNEMSSQLQSLAGYRQVTDSLDNLAEYGLDDPIATITLKDENDKSCTLYVGNTNSGADVTYVYSSAEDGVYTVSSEFGSYFTMTLLDLMELETLPLPDGTETYSTIILKDSTGSVKIKALDALDYDWDYLGVYEYQAVDNRSGEDEVYGVAGDSLSTFSSALSETYLDACVVYDAGEKDLKTYGLNNPAYTLTLKYTQQEVDEDAEESDGETDEDADEDTETTYINVDYASKIYIGVAKGESLSSAEYCYITWDGTNNIYQSDAATWAEALQLQKTDLTSMYPMDLQEDQVTDLEITYKNKTYSYENTVLTEDEDSDAEDEDLEEEAEETTEDEEDIEDTAFTSMLGTLGTIQLEDFYPANGKKVKDTEETVTIKAKLNRSTRATLLFSLTPYGEDYYVFSVDGTPLYLLNRTDVKGIIQELEG